ncbi:MAG: CRISPR-associated helicase Cas3' [Pyrinomonadaceae bacterium]
MVYLAHTENERGATHELHHHLRSVGQLASEFAERMNPAMCEAARWVGLLHDLGKYRDEFQEYLCKKREGSVETHHAVYGAALAMQKRWLGLAFAIAGHHAGLHNVSQLKDLVGSDKYRAGERLPQIEERFEAEVQRIEAKAIEPVFEKGQSHRAEFYVRLLFSALVDADFLDTEAHYIGAPRATQEFQPGELLQRLVAEKESKSPDGELNQLRSSIFQQCLQAAEKPPGFFSLTVPTGGGKTLSSMAFALAHAARHNLRRVIVVIPYLSIIEQNAAQYRRIFDPEDRGIVIEHHSAIVVPEDREERTRSPLEYAAENWDAPIIVTTSVQFIESLFANKTSRCRKLHNIARSVVIFDEVQTLPTHLLNPLLSIIRELKTNYGASFVFSTATQPAFRKSLSLAEGFAEDEVMEITRETSETFQKLRRVKFSLPKSEETIAWGRLAERIATQPRALCVVNVRRHAFELWEELRRLLPPGEREAVFHLSSAMCAQHRFDLLGEDREPTPGTIRARLRGGEQCRVISTQLIEAGVDVDFPVVWRALGPLDSIVQAAGRCNREGQLVDATGQTALGEVIIFQPEESNLPRGIYSVATGITASLLTRIDAEALATDHKLFEQYFSQLYQYVPTDYEQAGECSIQEDRENLRFREVARKARVIADDTKPVMVPYGKGAEIIKEIQTRPQGRGLPRFDKTDLRRLQRFMVNLRQRDFDQLLALKQITPLLPNLELYVLSEGFYHEHLGLLINQRPAEDFLQ